jgi:hypothetical protein
MTNPDPMLSGTQSALKSQFDLAAEWRVWQALSVWFTVCLNRQIQSRWLLERECLRDRSAPRGFYPVIFLEPIPSLCKSPILNHPKDGTIRLETIKLKVRLLRAHVEKCQELASEIKWRMQSPLIRYPAHFCHTCIVDGGNEDTIEVLLARCGHRICWTCLSFEIDDLGACKCSICGVPVVFVPTPPLSPQQLNARSGHISTITSKFALTASQTSASVTALLAPLLGIGQPLHRARVYNSRKITHDYAQSGPIFRARKFAA